MSQSPYILANPPKRKPVSGTRVYNVTLHTQITGIAQPVNSTIAYTLEITYSNHFFTFKKTNVIVDGNSIPSNINKLYVKIAEPLNTVKFRCTEQGTIKDLYAYEQLLTYWEQVKRDVKQQFTGTPVTDLLKQLSTTYTNKQALIQRLNTHIVLQVFYRSFLTDYLIYYGQNSTIFTNTGILNHLLLYFAGMKTLGLKDKQLHIQTDAQLNKLTVNAVQLKEQFQNKIEDFNLDDLEIRIQDRSLLDYDTLWINQSAVTQTVNIKNYKKKHTLTLQCL